MDHILVCFDFFHFDSSEPQSSGAKLAVGPTKDGKTVVGLFRKGSNHPLDLYMGMT